MLLYAFVALHPNGEFIVATPYLERPLRSLPEALADARINPFYKGDVDSLARTLLADEHYSLYRGLARANAQRCASRPRAYVAAVQ